MPKLRIRIGAKAPRIRVRAKAPRIKIGAKLRKPKGIKVKSRPKNRRKTA